VHLIVDRFFFVRGPTWSDDEQSLYFVGDLGGSRDLYRQRLSDDGAPDGSPLSVTAGVGMNGLAVMSPDETKLAYSKGGRVSNVWRVPLLADRPATWADARQITFDEATVEFVDVSPDGERLLVASDRTGNFEIWMLPTAEGSGMHQLTDHAAFDADGTWSPDGTEIGFYSDREGDRDIWVMPASGGPARRLTEGLGEDYGPTWSPDGEMIAFERMWSAGASHGRKRESPTMVPRRKAALLPRGRSLR